MTTSHFFFADMQFSLNFDVVDDAFEEKREPEALPESRRVLPRRRLHCDPVLSERARGLACDVRSYRVGSRVTVWWNPRLKTTAGTADSQRCRIDLNPKLIPLGVPAVNQILRHELAHLVAVDRHRDRHISPHGFEWKRACDDLGIPGERASHSLPLASPEAAPRYAYRCPHCRLVVRRQRRMSRGSACLECCEQYSDGDYNEDFVFERVAATIGDSI
ncbi:MAG: SprT-like domain-containing protein [Rhodothermales bacterium]|nr:SprT-like domain-containing protein [Rhodothermales bacterium]